MQLPLAAGILLLLSASVGGARRLEVGLHSCGPENCQTFAADAECSCAAFGNDDPVLISRAQEAVRNAVQSVRYVSDKLPQDSGILKKMWYGGKLGKVQTVMRFLSEAAVALPAVDKLVNTAVRAIPTEQFQVASALPIMVEIWDRRSLAADKLIGDVGLPLTPTKRVEVELPLGVNDQHRSMDPAGASVGVGYAVSRSSRHQCLNEYFTDKGYECVTIGVVVHCLNATGLPKSSFGADPNAFCKVRVKTDAVNPSMKKEGPTVKSQDPHFTKSQWSFAWEEPVIRAHPSTTPLNSGDVLVPWTLDEMSITEQLSATIYSLAKTVFQKEGTCDGKSGISAKICGAVDQLVSLDVDTKSFEAVAAETGDPDVEACAAMATAAARVPERATPPAGFAQVAEKDMLGNPIFAATHQAMAHNAAQRGGGAGAGPGVGPSNKGPGPLGWFIIVVIIIVVIVLMVA